jgi:hypothetical protein
MDDKSGFPESLSHTNVVSLPDVEVALFFHYLCASGGTNYQPLLGCTCVHQFVQKKGNASVGENTRVPLAPCGIHRGVGQ